MRSVSAARPSGVRARPVVAQRIQTDHRNALGAERGGDVLIESRPAAVAGHDDGKAVERAAPTATAPGCAAISITGRSLKPAGGGASARGFCAASLA